MKIYFLKTLKFFRNKDENNTLKKDKKLRKISKSVFIE